MIAKLPQKAPGFLRAFRPDNMHKLFDQNTLPQSERQHHPLIRTSRLTVGKRQIAEYSAFRRLAETAEIRCCLLYTSQ